MHDNSSNKKVTVMREDVSFPILKSRAFCFYLSPLLPAQELLPLFLVITRIVHILY